MGFVARCGRHDDRALGEFGADTRIVAFMQYLRVTFVVLTASLVSHLVLAHARSRRRRRLARARAVRAAAVCDDGGIRASRRRSSGARAAFPAAQFILPMVGGSACTCFGLMPIDVTWWLLDAAYITVGWTIGLAYTREILLFVAKCCRRCSLSTFVLLGMCALSGMLLVVLAARRSAHRVSRDHAGRARLRLDHRARQRQQRRARARDPDAALVRGGRERTAAGKDLTSAATRSALEFAARVGERGEHHQRDGFGAQDARAERDRPSRRPRSRAPLRR